MPQLAGVRQPDLLLVNDDDLTFAKIRLDERSWDTVAEHLGALVDPLARALVWGAAWDMTRDAEVSTGDFLRLVLSGIDRESDIGVVQGVLRQLKSAIDQFAAPEHRTDYLVRLATAVQGHAEAAAPGSDHQLAFTRGFVSARHDRTASSTPWPGSSTAASCGRACAVDTDLRWSMLQRLVAMGRLEDDAIEAEQDADDTATGRRQAAVARAARPTAVAKDLAWAEIVERTDVPNAIMEAIDRRLRPARPGRPHAPLSGTGTSPTCRRCGSSARTRWRRRSRWACTRCSSSTTRPSPPPTPSSPATTTRPCDASSARAATGCCAPHAPAPRTPPCLVEWRVVHATRTACRVHNPPLDGGTGLVAHPQPRQLTRRSRGCAHYDVVMDPTSHPHDVMALSRSMPPGTPELCLDVKRQAGASSARLAASGTRATHSIPDAPSGRPAPGHPPRRRPVRHARPRSTGTCRCRRGSPSDLRQPTTVAVPAGGLTPIDRAFAGGDFDFPLSM